MTEAFNPVEHARNSAAHALNAHDQASLDSIPEPPDTPWWQQARLATLLRDLIHYTDAHELNFEAALREARSWHRTDIAEQAHYKPGDEVKLRYTPHQGVVVALSSGQDTLLYEVRIIGKPYRRLLKPTDLARASAFPTLSVEGTDLLTATAAEQAFHQAVALAIQDPTSKRVKNCKLLADTLSTWSGVPRDELYLGARRVVSTHPGDLARQNYPNQPDATLTGPSPTAPHPSPSATHSTSKGPTP
ncbi:hypothetical protein [Actinocorallia populi]|uniref:hypothetical protein n=1 Tax=Actinocorallia populi TaxID=2079200 RepID=UPI000D094CC7|nr:hypothetical protein [Actinocorallia populi]